MGLPLSPICGPCFEGTHRPSRQDRKRNPASFLKPHKTVSEISYQETINNEQNFYPRLDRKVVIGKV